MELILVWISLLLRIFRFVSAINIPDFASFKESYSAGITISPVVFIIPYLFPVVKIIPFSIFVKIPAISSYPDSKILVSSLFINMSFSPCFTTYKSPVCMFFIPS